MDQVQQEQRREALIAVALIESKALSVSLAEIIAHLQKKEHLAALGGFRSLDREFRLLSTVLEAAAGHA